MKIYHVRRSPTGRVTATVVHPGPDGHGDGYNLPHLMLHSPDGYEFGYGGSGPSDLARSIVGDLLGTKEPDPWQYMALRREWVALLEGDGPHRIDEITVREIIREPALT